MEKDKEVGFKGGEEGVEEGTGWTEYALDGLDGFEYRRGNSYLTNYCLVSL